MLMRRSIYRPLLSARAVLLPACRLTTSKRFISASTMHCNMQHDANTAKRTSSSTSAAAAAAAAATAAPLTQGSYHSLLSADQTLLKDTPSISPRSLVKYLDSYVVGQTRAKKVLAVGVWNHYLRVASNQRMRHEREQRLQQQEHERLLHQQQQQQQQQETQQPLEEEHESARPPAWSDAVEHSRNLRLGKYKQTTPLSHRKADDEAWLRHKEIREQRNAEKARDPHGEAMRSLMFGRSEREWLYNAGGPSALHDAKAKFGDEAAKWNSARPPPPRVSARTPAEEAALTMKQRPSSLDTDTGSAETRRALLAEAQSRSQKGHLEPSGTDPARSTSDKAMTIGVFGGSEAPYFSSNTELDQAKPDPVAHRSTDSGENTHKPANSATQAGATSLEPPEKQKWGSAEERRAHAIKLVQERAARAVQDARARLPLSRRVTDETGSQARSPHEPDPAPTVQGLNPDFLSASPGTLPFFEKSNILLLGPSGSGKTLLLRTLAQALEVPFVHVDATPLTMAGYVGEDVESIIQRLLVESGWDVERAQRGIICIDEVDKLRRTGGGNSSNSGRDVGGEGVQQALLRMLEGTIMQIADKSGAAASASASSGLAPHRAASASHRPMGAAQTSAQEGDGLSAWYNHRQGKKSNEAHSASGAGQQGTTFQIDTSSILFVLSGAFVGIEDTIRKRLASLASSTVTTPSDTSSQPDRLASPAPKPRWSQTELLTRLEPVDLEQYGLIPEFIGRVPVSVVLNPLTHQDLVRIMTEPKNSLVDQYKALFKVNGIDLHVSAGAIDEIAHRAMGTTMLPAANAPRATTDLTHSNGDAAGPTNGGGGARSLRRIMEDTLLDAFYESYGSDSSVKYILVDRGCVQKQHLGVKLFSRGQKFDFEAQCRADADVAVTSPSVSAKNKSQQQQHKPLPVLSPQRARQARQKARRLIRCRFRVTNRLVDPIIYV